MKSVIKVNLQHSAKSFWYDSAALDVECGDKVVVRTAYGTQLGVVSSDPIPMEECKCEEICCKANPILRVATGEDIRRAEAKQVLADKAMPIFKEFASSLNPEMRPIAVEYMLNEEKAVFFFEAERRVDFRELVRRLASRLQVKVDMRQVGVRDETAMIGGIAHCGQIVCCKRFGGNFDQVSIRMAKIQDLSLNSQKISGLCGRLMCCLRFENEVYLDFRSRAPRLGATVDTPEGKGEVKEYDVVRDMVYISTEENENIKISLCDIASMSDNGTKCSVGKEAWECALEEARESVYGSSRILDVPLFTGKDKLGSSRAIHNERSRRSGSGSSQRSSERYKSHKSRRDGGYSQSGSSAMSQGGPDKRRRRRSTKLNTASGEVSTQQRADLSNSNSSKNNKQNVNKQPNAKPKTKGKDNRKPSSNKYKKASKSSSGKVRPGQKSSGLAHADTSAQEKRNNASNKSGENRSSRRKKRASRTITQNKSEKSE